MIGSKASRPRAISTHGTSFHPVGLCVDEGIRSRARTELEMINVKGIRGINAEEAARNGCMRLLNR